MDIKNNITPIRKFAEQLIAQLDELEAELEPNVEAGQYWEFGDGEVVRLYHVTTTNAHYKPISEDGENPDWFVGTKYLSQHAMLLSDDQIEQALIEEAERRGLLSRLTKLRPLDNGQDVEWMEDCSKFEYDSISDILFVHDRVLYEEGKWAEIIEDEWEVTSYPDVKGFFITNEDESLYGKLITEEQAEAIRDTLNDLED